MTFGLVKHNNNSISAITTPGNLTQGKMTLIKEQTASSSSSISFVDGSSSVVLDSTYPIYLFKFINIHPETNTTKLQIYANRDLAQSTSAQQLKDIGNTSDDSAAGTLHLFNPSSTTFVKHFISTFTGPTGESTQNLHNSFVGGYFNTTSSIDAVQFSMSSGNIDSGTIKLYGIKGS